MTEEEHNAFFTIGAGEDKNQIRQIYYHLVSMWFFIFAGYLFIFLTFLNSFCNWPYWLFGQHVVIKDDKDRIMTMNIIFIKYFSKQQS